MNNRSDEINKLQELMKFYEAKFNNSCFKNKERWLRKCNVIKLRIEKLKQNN